MGGGWRVGVAAVLVALASGACSDGDGRTAEPTVPRQTTTTDPFAVPEVIDVAYVERVMAELDRIYGDAAREVARERALTPRFEELMRSIYGDEESLALTTRLWEFERDRGFANIAPAPGNPTTTVESVETASLSCIVAAVTRSLDPLLVEPVGPSAKQEFVVLERGRANPTGWVLTFDGFQPDGSAPVGKCSD